MSDYYDAELPKYHRNYPLIEEGEASPPSPPEEKELEDFLKTLSKETIYQLLLIFDMGRQFFTVDELAEQYAILNGGFPNPNDAVSRLMYYVPILADTLPDALTELAAFKINVNKLPLKKKANARKR